MCESTAARYTAVYLCALGMFPAVGLIMGWTANSHEDDSSRATGFMLLNLMGQCGPLLGTHIFPDEDAPFFIKGDWISAAFLLLVALLSFCLRMYFVYQNRRLDRLQAEHDILADEAEKEGEGGGVGAAERKAALKAEGDAMSPFRYLL